MSSKPAKMDASDSATRVGTPQLENPSAMAMATASSGPPTTGAPSKPRQAQQVPVFSDSSGFDEDEWAEAQNNIIKQHVDENMTALSLLRSRR